MNASITYRDARRHVERKLGWLIHLVVYVKVNSSLLLLNLFLVPGRFRAWAPLFGWGIGLLFHGLAFFWERPVPHGRRA